MAQELDLLVVGGLLVIDHIAQLDQLPPLGGAVAFPGLTQALEEKYFGGNNVNLAAAAAALGLRVGLVCFSGEDFESSGYRTHLDSIGITDRWIQIIDGQDIANCYSFFDRQGTSLTFMDWPQPARVPELAIPDGVVESARQVVIIGGGRDDLDCGRILEFATTAHDAQVPVALAWAAGAENFEPRYFELASALLCNRFEIDVILKCFGLKGEDEIAKLGPKTVFVTGGAAGSDVYYQGAKAHIPAVQPSRVVDPTGAGDSYAGSVMAGFSWGISPEICGRIGAVVSSFVVEQRGCQTNPPSREQLEGRYKAAFGETLNDGSSKG